MTIASLSSASRTALAGIEDAVREVDDIAQTVAQGASDEPGGSFSDALSAVHRLPALKQQVLANAKVIETADELLSELGSLPRR